MNSSQPVPPPVQSIEFGWYVADKQGSARGPYRISKLADDAASGTLDGHDLVYHEHATQGEWVAVSQVPQLGVAPDRVPPVPVAARSMATVRKRKGQAIPNWIIYTVAAWATCCAGILLRMLLLVRAESFLNGSEYVIQTKYATRSLSYFELHYYGCTLAVIPILCVTVLFIIPVAVIQFAKRFQPVGSAQ